ncbi:hypothetical protein BC828DRAFT_402835 [Blastocladiella britannica]|nr:hypothetical protein BC828DRAFT_402835 [Blastocladiella britannica]
MLHLYDVIAERVLAFAAAHTTCADHALALLAVQPRRTGELLAAVLSRNFIELQPARVLSSSSTDQLLQLLDVYPYWTLMTHLRQLLMEAAALGNVAVLDALLRRFPPTNDNKGLTMTWHTFPGTAAAAFGQLAVLQWQHRVLAPILAACPLPEDKEDDDDSDDSGSEDQEEEPVANPDDTPDRRLGTELAEFASGDNHLAIMQWLSATYSLAPCIYTPEAIKYGRVDVLDWVKAHHELPPESVLMGAARAGSLATLIWWIQQDWGIDDSGRLHNMWSSALLTAAVSVTDDKSFAVVEWLWAHRPDPTNPFVMSWIQFVNLVAGGSHGPSRVCDYSARVLEWLWQQAMVTRQLQFKDDLGTRFNHPPSWSEFARRLSYNHLTVKPDFFPWWWEKCTEHGWSLEWVWDIATMSPMHKSTQILEWAYGTCEDRLILDESAFLERALANGTTHILTWLWARRDDIYLDFEHQPVGTGLVEAARGNHLSALQWWHQRMGIPAPDMVPILKAATANDAVDLMAWWYQAIWRPAVVSSSATELGLTRDVVLGLWQSSQSPAALEFWWRFVEEQVPASDLPVTCYGPLGHALGDGLLPVAQYWWAYHGSVRRIDKSRITIASSGPYLFIEPSLLATARSWWDRQQ